MKKILLSLMLTSSFASGTMKPTPSQTMNSSPTLPPYPLRERGDIRDGAIEFRAKFHIKNKNGLYLTASDTKDHSYYQHFRQLKDRGKVAEDFRSYTVTQNLQAHFSLEKIMTWELISTGRKDEYLIKLSDYDLYITSQGKKHKQGQTLVLWDDPSSWKVRELESGYLAISDPSDLFQFRS